MSKEKLLTVHPTTEVNWLNENVRTEGLLLRDYFAAKAMQGLLASHQVYPIGMNFDSDEFARRAYRIANAMLRAREE